MRLQTSRTKNAESFYIVESIYVDGKRSNKVVKKLGTLEQIVARIGPDKDPYEWGREQARLLTKEQSEEKEERISVHYNPSKRIDPDATNPKTVITREFPHPWQPGDEAYYPVNDKKNTALYEQYGRLAKQETNVLFGGRLAEYKYYDMDQVIAAALSLTARL